MAGVTSVMGGCQILYRVIRPVVIDVMDENLVKVNIVAAEVAAIRAGPVVSEEDLAIDVTRLPLSRHA